jgi:hypothetical protein
MRDRAAFRTTPWREALVASAALLFLAVACGGCAAAGMAAISPVLSAIEALSDRTVERTLPADLLGASAAALDTVSRLGFEVRDLQRADEAWTFEAANEKLAVHGQLTRLSSSLTRLSLRVEIGSFAADKSTADEILNQIAASLADQFRARASAAADSGGSSRLAEIEAELQRLRVEVEAARTRADRRPGRDEVDAREGAGTRSVPGVISIPASYGVPTIAAPSLLDSARPDWGGAAPLGPVNGLRAVQPATVTESGRK